MARTGKPSGLRYLLWLLIWANPLWAESLTGELDKPEGSLEDQFVYTLAVQGNADDTPQFPEIPGLSIRQAGTSQSVSIVNGRMSREVQYQFVLIPSQEGTFTIPAITLKIDGKIQETLPIEFKVNPAGTSSPGGSDRPIFMERVLSKNKVYVGESVLSSIRVYSRVRILAAEPDFPYPDGFQVKKIDGERSYTKSIEGQNYNVTEINALMIPSKEGKYEVPGASLNTRFLDQSKPKRTPRSMLDDLWGSGNTSEKNFRSAPVSIEVLPLPLAGRRADFSGLVGEFSGQADFSTRSVPVGETVTLTLIIEGKGATTGMADPELVLGDKAKVYKDKPQSQDMIQADGVTGQRSFKLAIVPSRAGDLDLGTLKIQHFNTAAAQYQDILIELGTIQVTGGSPAPIARAEAATEARREALPNEVAAAEVKSLGSDLLEPHAPDRLLKAHSLQGADFIGGGLLLGLTWVFAGFGLWRAFIRRQGGQREARKKASGALKIANLQMVEARRLLDRQELRSAVGLAQKVIRQYLGDKFSIHGGALTLRDLEQHLQQNGLSEQTIEEMRNVWQNLDQLLFASITADQSQGHDVLQKVDRLLSEMEQRCTH